MQKIFKDITLLSVLLLTLLFSCNYPKNEKLTKYNPGLSSIYFNPDLKPFYHGVASGDPGQDEVVIWTKITPDYVDVLEVKWMLSTDSRQDNIIKQGTIKTDSTRGFTVKKLVVGLKPDTYYWYSFTFEGKKSLIGRTKTLPAGNKDSVTFVTVVCNAYEGGYFNAFRIIGINKERIDAVVHLGDYIYEGYLPKYFNKKDRKPLPNKDCVTLNDYRTRYSQYHLDPNLMYAHQMHPFITIWDDHEFANDSYRSGALAHVDSIHGDYGTRREIARKAYYETLPIKDAEHHYRSFNLGGIAELFMIDGRYEGRTKPMRKIDPGFNGKERSMLGENQMNWLSNGLINSDATWKLIGNPVIFSELNVTPLRGDISGNLIDDWTGYPFERQRIIDLIESNLIENLIFISGDSHCSWAFEVKNQNTGTSKPVAIEFGVPSISSNNWNDSDKSDIKVINIEKELIKHPDNKHLKYVNLRDHGYNLITLTEETAKCKWYFVDRETITQEEAEGMEFTVVSGNLKLEKTGN